MKSTFPYIGLFSLQTCFIWVSSARNSFIRIRLGEASKLFENRPRSDPSVISPEDPLKSYNLQQRQRFCDQIIEAERFVAVEPDFPTPLTEIPIPLENVQRRQRSNGQRRNDLEYKPRQIKVSDDYRWINAFACAESQVMKMFVTYDAQRRDLVLLDDYHGDGSVVAESLLPRSSINTSLQWNQLPVYFLRQVLKDTADLRTVFEDMHLCNLDRKQHFHLCSSIVGVFIPQLHPQRTNYIILDQETRCQNKILRIMPRADMQVRVVPCVSYRNYLRLKFYVLPDLQRRAAAFVFVELNDDHDALTLIANVVDIPILAENRSEPVVVEST